ncbi:hypothetical protein TWF506_007111 [Arthrobotrys conoides]|uniref:Mid2 domain-containing protein n=1 Tax=Arthrobotrys conoides TaxID=74498 RepID=A0AAN8NA10_9PEZI
MRLWILLGLTALPSLITAQRRCYFPNGNLAPDHRACDPEAETDNRVHSSCCSIDDNVACLSSNYCLNQNGYVYRGACTDRDWEDSSCPRQHCQLFSGSGMNLLSCDDVSRSWCCADGGSTPCCKNENVTQFSLNAGMVTYIATVAAVTLPTTSISTTSEVSTTSGGTTTTTSDPSATSVPQAAAAAISTGAAVGMGIGITIPTILAILFAVLWWIERSKRKRQQTHAQPIVPPAPFASDYQTYGGGSGGLQPPELHSLSYSSELSGAYDRQPLQSADALELSAQSVKPPGYSGGY